MSWIVEVLLAVDRLGNAIAGGESESTVSGRVGYYAARKKNRYWKALEAIIDHTFLPIDGPYHCLNAMKRDGHFKRGNDIGLAVLCIFVVLACLVIWPLGRLYVYKNAIFIVARSITIAFIIGIGVMFMGIALVGFFSHLFGG